ncbi:MAG: sugar phosphate isomerase/epimerase [Candidatus Thorarchaeota archaeon]|nr:sugar phosphate isomerase/epimerase [Candidatus Thorarchaeota archaeon]
MKIGFLTKILGELDFEKLVSWASKNEFEALEADASPKSKHIDPEKILKGETGGIKKLLSESGIAISGLAYYPNNLASNVKEREKNHAAVRRMIEASATLDVSVVCTFVGGFPAALDEVLNVFAEVFPPLVDYAEAHGVKIAVENCPMIGWQAPYVPGNIAYSPEIWEKMFKIIPSKAFGLNLDPSHLVWQKIDYIESTRKFGDRIYHTHAKDTEILPARLSEVGIIGSGWWRYRIPGQGVIDWQNFIATLKEKGYDYVLSIEHEDPFLKGIEGLLSGKKYLDALIS